MTKQEDEIVRGSNEAAASADLINNNCETTSDEEDANVDEESSERRQTGRVIVNKQKDCLRLGISKLPLFICAPMVRYSKLPFRKLVRLWGCDMAYTPMIYAGCYWRSEKCRLVEFVTEPGDMPIVQFAANNPEDFIRATQLVYGHCRGVDLNCGCPKHETTSRGCGAALLRDPALLADIVRQCRGSLPPEAVDSEHFSMSVKIRLLPNRPISETIELCRKIEAAGVSHITVHGRTPDQRCEPPDYEAIAQIKASLSIPVYANGDCKTYQEALQIAQITGADGVMAANGLLANPALFAGHDRTPALCISDWISLGADSERWGDHYHFDTFHRQLQFMTRSLLSKHQRLALTASDGLSELFDVLRDAGITV